MTRRSTWIAAFAALAVIAGFAALFYWYEFVRESAAPPWKAENGHSAEDMRFLYGSIGGEQSVGIPYWIFYVMPRVFADKLPGPGGLRAFGIGWEEGKDLPIGFTTRPVRMRRVAQNCAICHTASYRTRYDENPIYVPTGPAHAFNLQAYMRFLVDCAKDPRFNAGTLMNEIESVRPADMTLPERLLYRFVLIPATRKNLLALEKRFAWLYRDDLPTWPRWGRGRDDAMNLTKYFLTDQQDDDTFGPTDFPPIWNIGKYKMNPKSRMNLAGDSIDARSVIIDSALGIIHVPNGPDPDIRAFNEQVHWLEGYLQGYPAPKFPYPIDAKKAAAGKEVFDKNCGSCHDRRGTTGGVTEPGKTDTDRNRLRSWNMAAAREANKAVDELGIKRPGLYTGAEPYGYVIPYLDGLWLRAPYLHNGSVPSLRALLQPAAQRPVFFYRGYDLYDPREMGFVSTEEQAARLGAPWDEVTRVATPYFVQWRGSRNIGHDYGTDLPEVEKDELIEFLKTR